MASSLTMHLQQTQTDLVFGYRNGHLGFQQNNGSAAAHGPTSFLHVAGVGHGLHKHSRLPGNNGGDGAEELPHRHGC